MTAYKFLASGGIGLLSRVAWPLPRGAAPGAWVEAEGPLAPCRTGVHVCRTFELAHWLSDELWEVEIGGEQLEGIDCLIARRARLVRPITAWRVGGAERFAAACAARAAALTAGAQNTEASQLADDAVEVVAEGYPAVSAYCAARAVARLHRGEDAARAYARERVWQSEWIARELIAG